MHTKSDINNYIIYYCFFTEQPLLQPLGFADSKVTDAPPSYEEATRSNLTEPTIKIAKWCCLIFYVHHGVRILILVLA